MHVTSALNFTIPQLVSTCALFFLLLAVPVELATVSCRRRKHKPTRNESTRHYLSRLTHTVRLSHYVLVASILTNILLIDSFLAIVLVLTTILLINIELVTTYALSYSPLAP